MNKNIDDLLINIDDFLDLKQETKTIDIEKVAIAQKEKKLREIRGNSYQIKALFFLGISLLGFDPRLETFVNVTILSIVAGCMLWLHQTAKKKMSKIDIALNFNEFHEQRINIASHLLDLYKKIKIVAYVSILVFSCSNAYFVYKNPDILNIIFNIVITAIGSFLIIRNMEGLTREYKIIIQS